MTHPSVDRIGFDFGVGGGGCWGREGGVLGGGGGPRGIMGGRMADNPS